MVATALAYANSFEGAFVLDDIPAIVENPNIRSLIPLSRSMDAPAETTVSGRPVTSLTLAISYAMSGAAGQGPGARPDPTGFHLFNLAIHICAGLTLFGVLRRTFLRPALAARFGEHATTLAGTIALFWLLHPLQTGSVTYIVQRAESLAGLFLLLALYCAIRAVDSPRSRTWSSAAIAACALGMGSKESMVAAPLLVVLWDWLFVDSGGRRRRGWLYAGLAATWLVLVWTVWFEHRPGSVGFRFAEWPWWRYLMTQAGVIVHYLRLSIVPAPLVLDYGWPAAQSVAAELPRIMVVASLLGLTLYGLIK